MFEATISFFERTKFDFTILKSGDAWLLIMFAALVVALIIWVKKRHLKFQERRSFRKRQQVKPVLDELDDNPKQLEFDF